MPVLDQPPSSLEILLTRLHESRDVSVYGAIERMVEAGESVGVDSEFLLGSLERGATLESLFEIIELRMQGLQKTA